MPDHDPGYWREVEEIFHAALELPADARAGFLGQKCTGNRDLFDDVQRVLAGFETQDRLSQHTGATAAGSRFGAFEVIRKIGEGGMGAVYLARRTEDFEQLVAIKVMRGTPAEVALMDQRFRRERQILANLNHPNIARVLDGGIAANGQPYLAMEFVEGIRVDEYCRRNALDLHAHLELFRKICAAVHFAHQHLVIHRDLKPGNILVTETGEPKLLDFGIAKVVEGQEAPVDETMTAGLMLTPEYASPEQIRGQMCTVASDVYSLGVTFYHLLCERGPFKESTSTPAEVFAAVLNDEPKRPSVAAAPELRRALRGDIDGIILKAIAKRPEDRYGSVEQLSGDIRRHLEGLPVSAVEGLRWYVARKFVRRHRVSVAAAAAVFVALIVGIVVTQHERTLAEQRFSDARKLANYLLFPLYDLVQSLPGSLPVRADMASESLAYLDRLAASKSTDRALRLELAEGYLRLGAVFQSPVGSQDSLGNAAKALESDQKAVALLDAFRNENDARVRGDVARANLLLGTALSLSGKPDEGIARLQQATQLFDQLSADHPRDAAQMIEAGRAYVALADAISGKGGGFVDMSTAGPVIDASDHAIAHFNQALAISPSQGDALLGIAYANYIKGKPQALIGPQIGLASLEHGIDALDRLPAEWKDATEARQVRARIGTVLGFCYSEVGDYPKAIAAFDSAQEILEAAAAQDPRNAALALRRITVLRQRATTYRQWKHIKESMDDYLAAVRIEDQLIAVDPAKESNRIVRAEMQEWVGRSLVDLGRQDEAIPYAKASLDYFGAIAERPDAAVQNLNEAAFAFLEPPIPSMADFARSLKYSTRADQLSNGKNHTSTFYMAQAYEKLNDGRNELIQIERCIAMLPPLKPGELPSRNRLLYDKYKRHAEALIKTGHVPKD